MGHGTTSVTVVGQAVGTVKFQQGAVEVVARGVELERPVLSTEGASAVAQVRERVAFMEPQLRFVVAEGRGNEGVGFERTDRGFGAAQGGTSATVFAHDGQGARFQGSSQWSSHANCLSRKDLSMTSHGQGFAEVPGV